MYLWQKAGGFFFQIKPPSNRIQHFGKTPVRVWLGLLPKREAKRRALMLAGAAARGFTIGMDRHTLTHSLKVLAEEIEGLKKDEVAAVLSAAGTQGRLRDIIEHADGEPSSEFISASREKIARSRARKEALASVRARLEKVGQALHTDAAALTAERAAYAHALATVASIERPAVVTAFPGSVSSSAEDEHRDEREITAETLLSAAGKVILDLRKEAKTDSNRPDSDDRYQERLSHALAAFIDVIGDKPLRHYLPLHVQEFATVMAKCPKNRTKYVFFEGLSIREITEANAERESPIPTLSTSAVGSLVSEVTNLWSKVTAGVDGIRDLKSYRITMPSAATKAVVREGLPTESLSRWLTDAAAIFERKYEYKRFFPLVALLTGMRLGEIVWLQPKDFVEIDGHLVIDLRLPLRIDGKDVDRQLKTKTSPRVVALHPFLTEAGFINFARKRRREWVFNAFHQAKDPSDAAGKQMAYWIRKVGIHEHLRQVFHSLRHNTKHRIRVPLGKLIADRQCGHAPKDVADAYGFRVLQSDEIEQIEALPLPKGVDFSGYFKARNG